MRGSHTIGIVGASAALLGAASPQGVSAEVLYLNDLNSVSGNAVAYANGTAVASGGAATSYLTAKTRAEFSAFSAPNGIGGGVSVGVGFASGRVLGMASSATTLTGAPIVTSWRTGYSETARTTTTTTTEFETLQATAFDYEEMTSQFTSPSSATFAFDGKAETSLDEAVFTTITSTLTKTLVAEGDNHGGAPAPTVTTTTRSTRVKTMFAPPEDPNISISSHAQAEASSTNSSAYTFEVLGAPGGGIAITYATEASLDGTVAYQIDLIDELDANPPGHGGRDRLKFPWDGSLDFRFPRHLYAHRQRAFRRRRIGVGRLRSVRRRQLRLVECRLPDENLDGVRSDHPRIVDLDDDAHRLRWPRLRELSQGARRAVGKRTGLKSLKWA